MSKAWQLKRKAYGKRTQYNSLMKITDNSYWIFAKDFKLRTKKLLQHHQTLLKQLAALKEVELLVFDLRANTGGSSSHGFNLLKAVDPDDYSYLRKKLNQKLDNPDASYRISGTYLKFLKGEIQKQGQLLPANSSRLKSFKRFLNNYQQALNDGEETAWQSELFGSQKNTSSANQLNEKYVLNFTGKIIVVTDSSCVSACLDFIDLFKQHPNGKHLGITTNADTAYIENVTITWDKSEFNPIRYSGPVKKWNRRARTDNQPYIPDIRFTGDIRHTEKLQKWVLEQARSF